MTDSATVNVSPITRPAKKKDDLKKAAIARECMEALDHMLGECAAFQSGQIYLLELEVAAKHGNRLVNESHNKFIKRLSGSQNDSPYHYFIERSFISLVTAFELFLQKIAVAVIGAYPRAIGQVEFKLADIVDAPNKDELIRRGIVETLNKMAFKKPLDYLEDVASFLSIEKFRLEPTWHVFLEAKARRDLGLHNEWRCNAAYLRKRREIGMKTTLNVGDAVFPHKSEYLYEVIKSLSDLSGVIAFDVIKTHTNAQHNAEQSLASIFKS